MNPFKRILFLFTFALFIYTVYLVYPGKAVLEYELKNGVMDMLHTGVPTAYRGHGIAKILVQVSAFVFST